MATKRFPRLRRTVNLDVVRLVPERRDAADGSGDAGEPATYRVAISSESETERVDWWTGQRYIEILSHAPEAVDMSRFEAGGISFLADHDPKAGRGLLTNPAIGTDRVMRADLRFSPTVAARELESEVVAGTRPYTSMGYDPIRARMVETRDDGIDVWLIDRWQPMEASSVTIPADLN